MRGERPIIAGDGVEEVLRAAWDSAREEVCNPLKACIIANQGLTSGGIEERSCGGLEGKSCSFKSWGWGGYSFTSEAFWS